MDIVTREGLTAQAFVELADTLVADFDVIEFLQMLTERCAQLLDVDAVGILLTDQSDHLQLVAASTEQARCLELFQLQSDQGPCLDAFNHGKPVICTDLAAQADRWPIFSDAALKSGFAAVHALPMRLREETIGALNLFSSTPVSLDPDTQAIGQALADIATIGIMHQRAVSHREQLTEQLQFALNTRIIIEQAKGMLAERHDSTMAEAFTALRGHARNTNQKLTDVANAVIDGTGALAQPAHTPPGPQQPPL